MLPKSWLKLLKTAAPSQPIRRCRPLAEALEDRSLLSNFALGDIAFTGYQATTPDKVSFVLLTNISGTSTLTIADQAWTGSALTTNEGSSTITFTGSFTAGTQFDFDATRAAGAKWTAAGSTTGIADVTSSNFGLNGSGDNLFAYDGSTAPTTGGDPLWVSAFATNAFLTVGPQTTSLTLLPSAFTLGDTAFSLGLANGTANSNGAQTAPATVSGTAAAIRSVVYTVGNWTAFTTAGAQAIPPAITYTLSGSNTPPTVASNTGLSLNVGTTATVTQAMLRVTDAEQGPAALTYTLGTAPASGVLRRNGVALNAGDTFTQADIDGGLITYVAPGSGTADSFTFTVSDGAGGTIGSTTFNITLTVGANTPPTLAANTGLTLIEGATASVTTAMLQVTDPEQAAAALTYTVGTVPANGVLRRNGVTLNAGGTFTQADIDGGLISYVHGGGELPSDSFTFTVSDGAGGSIASTTFAITVTPVNDDPTIAINRTLTLHPGQVVAVSNAILLAADPDSTATQLAYTVTTGPTKGTITKNLIDVTAFTQTDLNAGDTTANAIRYTATTAVAGDTDTIVLSLTDGTSTPITVTLNVSIVSPPAPVSYTGSYSQNFDDRLPTPVPAVNSSLPGAMILPQGWLTSETGNNASNSVRVDSGAQSTGDSYFYGAAGSNERALGTQASGSNSPVMVGVALTNTTGSAITSLNLSYVGEQWRKGTGTDDKMAFEFSTDATSLTTGTYTAVTALDFIPPGAGAANQPTDGNLAANQVAVSGAITGITWAPGTTIFLRWTDVNSSGNDDGMAIDSVSVTGGATSAPTLSGVQMNGTAAPSATVTLSRVTSLVLNFSTAVNIAPGAFSLTNGTSTITSAAGGAISVAGSGTNTVTLTFTGSSGVDFGSLADGIWTLSTNMTLVTAVSGGTAGTGTTTTNNIRRLYGDIDGNGVVNSDDFDQFGNTFGLAVGEPGYLAGFDFDNNGVINSDDFDQFGNRFGIAL